MRQVPLIFLALILLVTVTGATPVYPEHITKYVTDNAGLLSGYQIEDLNDKCAALDKRTGVEIAIITVPTTGGQDVIGYATRTGEINGVGKAGVDNGIVILFSEDNEAGFAIATGRGSESTVTDAYAARFGREAEPLLNEGKYYEAFELTVRNIDGIYETEQPTAALAPDAAKNVDFGIGMIIATIVATIVVVLCIIVIIVLPPWRD